MDLRHHLSGEAVVSLVVRGGLFENPNSVMVDLVELIERNRSVFTALKGSPYDAPGKWGLVLLARSELSLAQASSPVTLPEWFPVHGGRTVHTTIEDLTWTADAPLNGRESNVDEICRTLFDLEGAALSRLKAVHEFDHGLSNSLLQLIRRKSDPPESFNQILGAALNYRGEVRNPSGFRPSVKDGRSLTARLWHLVATTPADQLRGPGQALAVALNLSDKETISYHESVLSVLFRPSQRDSDLRVRFCRNLFVVVASSCRLTTAAAHSDEYSTYPIPLLRTLSQDLRRSLDSTTLALKDLAIPS